MRLMPDAQPPLPSGLQWPVRCDPSGSLGPTRRQARGRAWVRVSHGLYVPAHVDRDRVEQRIVEAAARLPSYGGVTGWAALRWAGGRWFDGFTASGCRREITMVTSCADVRSQPGLTISAEHLRPEEVVAQDGLRITVHVRSVLFEMRHAPTDRLAVVAADMAAAADLTSLAELRRHAATLGTWTGIPRARRALDLADENSWSPAETLMRLVWMLDAGLPRPMCNVAIFDLRGGHLATVDLLDVEAGVVGEYDSALHLVGTKRAEDVRREADLRAAGLEHFTLVTGDLSQPEVGVRRMLAARDRARFAAPSQRAWTIEPPRWWVRTDSVERRRALTDVQRATWLRYRGA